tara:strand:+ start:65 stop:280 length:216 start_codon:yes stop_codon:yes gene_type:complete
MKNNNLEKSLERLNIIVEEMELDNSSLENILDLYKEGISLIKDCELKIIEAEKQIKLLINDNEELELKDFE